MPPQLRARTAPSPPCRYSSISLLVERPSKKRGKVKLANVILNSAARQMYFGSRESRPSPRFQKAYRFSLRTLRVYRAFDTEDTFRSLKWMLQLRHLAASGTHNRKPSHSLAPSPHFPSLLNDPTLQSTVRGVFQLPSLSPSFPNFRILFVSFCRQSPPAADCIIRRARPSIRPIQTISALLTLFLSPAPPPPPSPSPSSPPPTLHRPKPLPPPGARGRPTR